MVTKEPCEKRYYFDWAASAPNDACSLSAPFANPSSQHSEGRAAKHALEEARERCAAVLNVPPDTLYFTSGGTESNSIALFSNLLRKGNGRVIAPETEHSSIREGMETLEKMGRPTGKIGVDSTGRVNEHLFAKALEKYKDVRFASVMAVNNETGSITDIASIHSVIRKQRESGAPLHLHCDLVQAVGKIPLDIQNWEIDSASISAHKIGGMRGIGLLYLRSRQGGIEAFYAGGGQERKIRGGTENTQGAISLASCLEKHASSQTVKIEYEKAKGRFTKLIKSLISMERCIIIPQVRGTPPFIETSQAQGINTEWFSPYILQAAFKDIPGEVMARALDDLGFAVSTGSACSSSSPERPVLMAMGIAENLQIEGIRISQGWSTTEEEIDLLIDAIAEVLKFL